MDRYLGAGSGRGWAGGAATPAAGKVGACDRPRAVRRARLKKHRLNDWINGEGN